MTFDELPGWRFDIREVSAGVFKAIGTDEAGRNIEIAGTDPEELIEFCKQRAIHMMGDDRETL